MILDLPVEAAEGYKSPSQRTRVITETWMWDNMYCPACSCDRLRGTAPGTEAVDFVCSACDEPFQLKALSKPIGHKIVDAAYDAMMRAILKNQLPHFLFLSYRRTEWSVSDLLLVPRFCLGTSAIEKRRALKPTARRAGWVGCNILLDLVPPEGRIPVVSSGVIRARSAVRKGFSEMRPLEGLGVNTRGWTLDVLTVLRTIEKREFTIDDAYLFERVLSERHPDNRHVRAKIRQQLQVLRDVGYLEFIRRGYYRWAKR